MMRSVLKGAALGAGVSVLVLGTASIMAPLPRSTPPAVGPVDVPAGSDFARGRSDQVPNMPNPAGAPLSAPSATPRAPVSQSNSDQVGAQIAASDPGTRPVTDALAPTPQPQAGEASQALGQAPAPEQPIPVPPPGEVRTPVLGASEVRPEPEAKVTMPDAPPAMTPPPAAIVAPAAPQAAPAGSGTQTASSPAPSSPEPAQGTDAGSATLDQQMADLPPLPDVQGLGRPSGAGITALPDSAAAPSSDALAPSGEAPAPALPDLPKIAAADMPQPELQPAPQPDAQPDMAPAEVPQPDADGQAMPDLPPAKPRVITLGSEPQRLPGQPVEGFRSAPNVIVDRLPQIGAPGADTPPADAPEADGGPGADQAPAADNTDLPPIERYALPFVHDDAKALYSVVLIDPGIEAGGLDAATIAALDFPVTIAIDPTRPNAAEDAQALRAAGHEVAILAADLPPDATPEDLEVALEAWRQVIPEAVAVVERPKPVFQNTRNLARQMVSTLGREGLGLVTQNRGFDSADQIASTVDLPRAKIWRVLDGAREKAPVVERMLSRAGFEADRNGQIVVMLSAWPETVSALIQWAPDAGTKYDLAPVSAVALQNTQGAAAGN